MLYGSAADGAAPEPVPDLSNERVTVLPFERQLEGGEVIVGLREGTSFVALPPEAVEILDDLAAGATFGEAAERYRRRHGEVPDVEGLVRGLEAEGLVRWRSAAGAAAATAPARRRFHFSWFPRRLAAAAVSRPVIVLGGAVVLLALAAVVWRPGIVPGPSALYFSHHLGIMVLLLAPAVAMQIALHELSHLVGARARGVPVRFGVGTRLWLIVLETDMSGVWTLPRRQRYLPILAGPFLDAVCGSLLILLLAADAGGLVVLSPIALGFVRAMVIVYLYQLIWQCFFFVRTDFYYVTANLFGCKNLMGDTVALLRNRWARWRGRPPVADLSHVPARELRVVRGYSLVWLAGRILALSLLFFVQLPIVFAYLRLLGGAVVDLFRGTPMAAPEILVPTAIALFVFVLGMFLWLRGLRRSAAGVAVAAVPSGEKESTLS